MERSGGPTLPLAKEQNATTGTLRGYGQPEGRCRIADWLLSIGYLQGFAISRPAINRALFLASLSAGRVQIRMTYTAHTSLFDC
jgi:hypothetical protein